MSFVFNLTLPCVPISGIGESYLFIVVKGLGHKKNARYIEDWTGTKDR